MTKLAGLKGSTAYISVTDSTGHLQRCVELVPQQVRAVLAAEGW